MIQAESLSLGCVCPDCLYRCSACMGTNTVVSREDLRAFTFVDRTQEEAPDVERETGPLRPEELID